MDNYTEKHCTWQITHPLLTFFHKTVPKIINYKNGNILNYTLHSGLPPASVH